MNYNNLFKKARENDITSLQIVIKNIENIDIETRNGNLEKYEIGNNKTVVFKGIYKNKTTIVSQQKENIDEDEIINMLKINAKLSENNDKDIISDSKEKINEKFLNKEINIKNVIDDLKTYSKIPNKYKELKNLTLNLSRNISSIEILNSNNLKLKDEHCTFYFGVESVSKENDNVSTSYDFEYDTTYDNIDIKNIVNNNIKDSINKIHQNKVKSGKYKVLMKNTCMAQILYYISNIFSADNIQNNKSLLVGMQNKNLFGNKITIVEDPTNKKLPGKRLFDDEGVLTSYKEIIKDGIFKTAIYDSKTALKENMKSTGNQYGNIEFRNMYLKHGIFSYEELLNNIQDGILIDDINGMHAGINSLNGNITLQASGYIIKDGIIMDAINLFTISTNFIELLKSIESVGNDLKFINKVSGSPSVVIKDMSISS